MSNERWRYDPFAPPPVSLTGVIQPPAAASGPVEPRSDDGLDDLKKAELVAMADDLGVDSSGNKADIVARLRAL
jgi:hypothetical protein